MTKIVLGFLVMVSIGFATSESSALHELFKDIDLNKDSKVDRAEFSKDMKEKTFEKLDADKDKEITEKEWEAVYGATEPEMRNELFKRTGKDKKRGITFFEFSDYADRHSNIDEAFMGLDKNGNNSLEPDEVNARPLLKWITVRF